MKLLEKIKEITKGKTHLGHGIATLLATTTGLIAYKITGITDVLAVGITLPLTWYLSREERDQENLIKKEQGGKIDLFTVGPRAIARAVKTKDFLYAAAGVALPLVVNALLIL